MKAVYRLQGAEGMPADIDVQSFGHASRFLDLADGIVDHQIRAHHVGTPVGRQEERPRRKATGRSLSRYRLSRR